MFATSVGWLFYAALLAATGSVAARWLVAPRVRGPARGTLLAAAGRVGLAAGAALPLAMAGVLWRQLADFRDPFSPWGEDLRLLVSGTAWGRHWTWAAAASLLALLAFAVAWAKERRLASSRVELRRDGWARGWERTRWAVAALLTAALCLFPAFSGHASASAVPWLSVPADVLHVLAAGSWTGTLLVVVAAELAARRGGRDSVLPALVPAFSPVALASAAVLVCTGGVLAVLHLGSPADVIRTPWGRIFAVKIMLAAGVLAVGAWNWRRLSPLLARSGGKRAMRRAAAAELALAQAVVAATAFLTRFSPPAGALSP